MKEFNDHHAQYLSANLAAVQLPQIDVEDKRMLLAVIDTVGMVRNL
jgi:hypothetical protein